MAPSAQVVAVLSLAFLTSCVSSGSTPASSSSSSRPACTSQICPDTIVTGSSLSEACAVMAATDQYNKDLCYPQSFFAAPESFNASFITAAGDFVLSVRRDWAPKSADRFYNLLRMGYYDGTFFYRVVDNFVAQWGPSGHPELAKVYANNNCVAADVPPCLVEGACFYVDEVKASNRRGFVSMSTDVKSSTCACSCQEAPGICDLSASDSALVAGSELYVNLVDNLRLDPLGFAPFAQVVEGMDVVDSIFKGYGEMSCMDGACVGNHTVHNESVPCQGPDFRRIYTEGNAYLSKYFPLMTQILSTQLILSI